MIAERNCRGCYCTPIIAIAADCMCVCTCVYVQARMLTVQVIRLRRKHGASCPPPQFPQQEQNLSNVQQAGADGRTVCVCVCVYSCSAFELVPAALAEAGFAACPHLPHNYCVSACRAVRFGPRYFAFVFCAYG
jgi:hypothetical protein